MHVPSPQFQHGAFYGTKSQWSSNYRAQLFVGLGVTGRQWGDINRISNRLVARTVDYISQCLLGILYRTALWISIPQVY